MLDSIVVPLMVFQDYGIMKAWPRAFDLVFASLGEFILYAYLPFYDWDRRSHSQSDRRSVYERVHTFFHRFF